MSETNEFPLHPVLDVPLQLVAEAAIGTSSLEEICARYNYSPEQTEQLRNDPGFQVRVSRMEQELSKEGVTTKMRARHVVDDLIGEVWIQAKDPAVGLGMKLEAIKTLTKIADLEPKQNIQQQGSGGYSIKIILPEIGSTPGRTIEMNSFSGEPVEPETIPSMGMTVPELGTMNRKLNSSIELPEDWDE
jgi:hypothetical protein